MTKKRGLIVAVLAASVALLASGGAFVSTVQADDPALYGVVGDGGGDAETLFRIDHTTGATTFLRELGNGNDGEEIAYNPDNGMILHASGFSGGNILEWIDPSSLALTPIPSDPDDCNAPHEVSGLVYDPHRGHFLAASIVNVLCSLTTGGDYDPIADLDFRATGLAFVGDTLYAVDRNEVLYILDPDTGDVISDMDLEADDGNFRALAAHPCTGELYASFGGGEGDANDLVIIDPSTGGITVVGDLGDTFAGLTFVGDCGETSEPPSRPRRNVAGGVANLPQLAQAAQANRERAAAAAAPVIAPPSTGSGVTIRPPSTGDGGLVESQSGLVSGTLLVLAAGTAGLGLSALRVVNRRR